MSNETTQYPVMDVWLWHAASGAKVGFHITLYEAQEIPIAQAASEQLTALLANGYSVKELDANGQEAAPHADIFTVMRRAKPSDDTPIIDFYPEWGLPSPNGKETYGTYKALHVYLNDDAEIEKFLQASGFNSLEDIPLYDGQAPLKRVEGKVHPKEKRVPTPFTVYWELGKPKINQATGETYEPKYLKAYAPLSAAAKDDRAPADNPAPQKPAAPPWWGEVTKNSTLLGLLRGSTADKQTALSAKLKSLLKQGIIQFDDKAAKVIAAARESLEFDNLGGEVPYSEDGF